MRFCFISSRLVKALICLLCLSAFVSNLPRTFAAAEQSQKAQTKKVTVQPVQADGGWPRSYMTPTGASMIVYTPQIASWENQKHMILYAAVAYTPKNTAKPVFGSVKAEVTTRVALEDRLVELSIVKITDSHFPMLYKEQVQEIVGHITSGIPQHERVIALDRVLASVDTSQIIPKNVQGVKADPPVVFFSKTPAVVVNIDGDPVWSSIPQNDLKYAVNTNWDLFGHSPTKTVYLRHNTMWLSAASVQGPWARANTLPESFSKLPSDDNWKEVRLTVPPDAGPQAVPKVFVSTKPAELILLKGEPQYVPVKGTQLLWVGNTESDVFRMGTTGPVYYLVSGRWFAAPDFNGPWAFATPQLPEDFARIPLEHERSRVLASVPGTPQAAEGVLLAEMPQTARVNKKEVKAPDVAYQGEPRFQPITNTALSFAENTDRDIIKVGDLYYMCFQGVWFRSNSPSGPWELTGSVPKEIYEIPIDSPVHNVTYVTVEEDSDEWVEFAATAAYDGMMVAWGAAVWGDGYYYPPYIDYGGYYPAYYPRYPTYGYGAHYNPWTGAYSRGVFGYGPYGGAGVGARYNPSTGTYSRGAAAYGPSGGRAVAGAYNPRTGTAAATRQGSGVYGNWGTTAVRRGDDWAASAHRTGNISGKTTGAIRTREGDVYAGRDGNVYRKQGDSWQKYNNGSWNNFGRPQPRAGQTPSPTIGQLDRDSAIRREGATRTQDFGSVRSGSSQRTGSFRPSGGGFRGGGFGGGGFRGGGRRR